MFTHQNCLRCPRELPELDFCSPLLLYFHVQSFHKMRSTSSAILFFAIFALFPVCYMREAHAYSLSDLFCSRRVSPYVEPVASQGAMSVNFA